MGADANIKAAVSGIPAPKFEHVSANRAPALADATVAVVTTAGLRSHGDASLWSTTDGSFTVLPHGTRDVQLSHFSPNFDRSGFADDINVVLPIDRFDELCAAGTIGAVSPIHISFMGAQMDVTYSQIIHDTGPHAAQLLLDAGVDVVLLTPV